MVMVHVRSVILILGIAANGGEWRNLIDGDYLSTCGMFRQSGFEVAEPGLAKGTVLVHYFNWDLWEAGEDVKDTIVKPTFSRIDIDD